MTPIIKTPLLTLLFLTICTTLPLVKADWNVDLCLGHDCSEVGLISVGSGSQCIQQGGNSWSLVEPGGCSFSSWSGNNCEGESTRPTQDEACYRVPFGSIKVAC